MRNYFPGALGLEGGVEGGLGFGAGGGVEPLLPEPELLGVDLGLLVEEGMGHL